MPLRRTWIARGSLAVLAFGNRCSRAIPTALADGFPEREGKSQAGGWEKHIRGWRGVDGSHWVEGRLVRLGGPSERKCGHAEELIAWVESERSCGGPKLDGVSVADDGDVDGGVGVIARVVDEPGGTHLAE